MKGLLIKDLLVIKKSAFLLFLMMLVFAVFFIPMGGGSFLGGYTVMVSSMLVITAVSYDERAKWDAFALAMPITRRQVVLEKYILMVLTVVAGGLIAAVLNLVVSLTTAPAPLMETVLPILLLMAVGILISSVMLPLLYKLGAERARLLMVLCILVPIFALTYLYEFWEKSGKALPPGLAHALAGALPLAIPIALFLVVAASYSLSVHIYERKEF